MNSSAHQGHRNPESRKHTKAWKSCAVGAAAVAALLTSTACGPDADDGATGGAPSVTPGASGTAGTSGTASTASTSGSPEPSGSATAPEPSGTSDPEPSGTSDGGGAVAACTGEALAVSSQKEPADSKDARHLLITVQNAGDRKCALYHAPLVRLGADARTTVPVIEDSSPDPGKPVVLAPGEEAHAALLVSGGARDEYEATGITLTLQGSEPGSKVSGPIDVPLPVAELYADDGQLITHWSTASGYALDFIMSK